MSTTQPTLSDDGLYVYAYELGDLLADRSARSDSEKLILTECPICASDPTRPRYHFDTWESRPAHFERHGQGEFGGVTFPRGQR